MTKPKAAIYRMVMSTHTCPFGVKALHLLKRKGYDVEDHWLTTRDETDVFKGRYAVKTTPQVFIDGKRIGGHDDLRRHFGLKVADPSVPSYTPVIAVFATAALIALAISWLTGMGLGAMTVGHFIAVAMMLLAMLKLQDISRFTSMFLGYDLLARRWLPYAYLYPFAQLGAGGLMLAGTLTWLSAPVAFLIGGIGAVSIYKAVYVEKRELKCACVGGGNNVPLGFVSLLEDVLMVAMAVWMGVEALL